MAETEDAAKSEDNPEPAPEKGQAVEDPTTEEVSFGPETEVADVEEGKSEVVADPVLGALETAGIEHTFKSGDEFVKSYDNLRRKAGEFDQERALGREVMPHVAEYRAFVAEKVKAEQAEAQRKLWDVPSLPANFEMQMGLEEDKRDPAFVEAVNARSRYLGDKWASYTEDPGLMWKDHFEAKAQKIVQDALAGMTRMQELHKQLDPQREFIVKNYDAVRELEQQMPLELAVELLRLREATRSRTGKEASEAAKASDVEDFAVSQSAPLGVASPKDVGTEPTDYRAIAKEEAERI